MYNTLAEFVNDKQSWVNAFIPAIKLAYNIKDMRYDVVAAYAPGTFSQKNTLTKVNTTDKKISIESAEYDKVNMPACDLWLSEIVYVTLYNDSIIEVNVNMDSASAMLTDIIKAINEC